MVTFEALVLVHVTDSFLLMVLAETSSSSSVASSGMHLLEVVLASSSISSDFSLWKMIQQAILSHPNSQLNMKQT